MRFDTQPVHALALERLAALGVVGKTTGRRRGRIFRYTSVLQLLRPNVQAARVDSSQIARVSDETSTRPLKEWAPIVAERLFRRPEVRRVIVFGSVGRGEEGPESDLDLLVVLDHVENSHDDAVRMLNELRQLPIPVNVLVTDDVRLQTQSKQPGVVRVALREGRVIERASFRGSDGCAAPSSWLAR